ncbi:MAG: hydrolase [Pseudomonadota bacterium]
MPIIQSEFRAAWWLPGAHAQTIWPSLVRRRILPEISWERVELEDGDFIDLAWSGPEDGRIVLFMHGLEGSLQSHYAGGIMRQLNQKGFRVCLMHFRGCSGEPNRLSSSYHSGKTDDPQQIVEHIQSAQGKETYAAVGVSLGGNVLLKWLGEQGASMSLQKAVAVSVPFQLDEAACRLRIGLSRLYQHHLLTQLRDKYRQKFEPIHSPLDVDIDAMKTFRQFDHQVTAELHGFDGVDDYYRRCSSRQYIPRIRVPTLILHAKHDPFVFPETAPAEDELPDNVWLEMPESGGHVGFVRGLIPGWADYWAEQRITQWLSME